MEAGGWSKYAIKKKNVHLGLANKPARRGTEGGIFEKEGSRQTKLAGQVVRPHHRGRILLQKERRELNRNDYNLLLSHIATVISIYTAKPP